MANLEAQRLWKEQPNPGKEYMITMRDILSVHLFSEDRSHNHFRATLHPPTFRKVLDISQVSVKYRMKEKNITSKRYTDAKNRKQEDN